MPTYLYYKVHVKSHFENHPSYGKLVFVAGCILESEDAYIWLCG